MVHFTPLKHDKMRFIIEIKISYIISGAPFIPLGAFTLFLLRSVPRHARMRKTLLEKR